MDNINKLLETLRDIQTKLEAPPLRSEPPPFGGDEIKTSSYAAFVESHPEWPGMYAYALEHGLDPLDHWLSWLWRDETCPACGRKGHKHHPLCRCKAKCSGPSSLMAS